jgi:hypothetical protein
MQARPQSQSLMFEILPTPIQECLPLLHDILRNHSNIMEEATSIISTNSKATHPFVQLNHEEMSGEEVDRILGYAGISTYDTPIGLPLEFEPITTERGLVFSLVKLKEYITLVAPDVALDVRTSGSMDQLANLQANALTARQYLVGGVLACIDFCEEHGEALLFHW